MSAKINNVVFDIGNVLIEWNPEHLYKTLIEDAEERQQFLTDVCSMEWNLQQDLGRSWAEATELLSKQHPQHADLIAAYSDRWHDMVPGAIEGTVTILETLKAAKVPVYAITNFSTEKFGEAQERFPFLANSFLDIVVSGDERVVKPDLQIYNILFERNDLAPEDCVFIDDSRANVEGSRAAGMTGLHFTSPEQLQQDLKELGLPV